MARGEFENSAKLTNHLVNNNINLEIRFCQDQDTKRLKQEIKSAKMKAQNKILKSLREEMGPIQFKLNELACAKGASNWLTLLPQAEEGYDLNKELFWDLIRIRYGYQLKRMPVKYECCTTFDLQHALSCKKGGFVLLRNNELRNVIALMLKTVCKDVTTEPSLQPLKGEDLHEVSAITGD